MGPIVSLGGMEIQWGGRSKQFLQQEQASPRWFWRVIQVFQVCSQPYRRLWSVQNMLSSYLAIRYLVYRFIGIEMVWDVAKMVVRSALG